ncbi:MAG TPA: heavy metal sensor histidine kinase [Bryobacteraceae bacterium]|nr:heavy metal sensor histidine kinase [Bryobacteraceae bacterium]
MTHWSIGSRLTLWYSLVLLAGLTLFSVGVWLVVSHSLRASLDESLIEQAKGITTVLQTEFNPAKPEHLKEEVGEYADATPEGNLMEVWDSRSNPLATSKVVSAARSKPSGDGFGVQEASSGRYRTYTAIVTVRGEPYHVFVAAPLESTQATLRRTRELLLWVTPAVLLIAALGGYWISRRALAPVDEITRAAQSIGIRNLSQRLTVPKAADELQRLSETWNGMLARLEGAVKRLSEFTADASHELRTPVALIRATAELTLRRERPPETYRESLRQIMAESDRMTHLIDDLLVLARADAGLPALPLDRLELTPLVRDVCEQGQVLAQSRQLDIRAEIPDEPIYVAANDPALRRLLLLLVDNAVKYTPAGGHITVSVGRESGAATVTVRDTGIGIPDAALPHVFERFYRVDESRNRDAGGAGLGLSIAKWIAEVHHASLEAESVVGQGSAFRVRFPQS